jgi:hypothetical protein
VEVEGAEVMVGPGNPGRPGLKQLEINESKWRDFIAVCYLEVTEIFFRNN